MYITDLISISAQPNNSEDIFSQKVLLFTENRYYAKEPSYSGIIEPNQLRRMGRAVRFGIGAGLPLARKHDQLDGIIIGSAEGGLEDCIKFLNQIMQYKEGTLTPTNFVQSTPNAVSGQLALLLRNTGYNITHVHKGFAFENALLDAMMHLHSDNGMHKLLVGSVEEISDYNYNIENATGFYKKEKTASSELFNSQTSGTICGEGASMFVIERKPKQYLAQIKDIDFALLDDEKSVQQRLNLFLEKNNIDTKSIDTLIVGLNGDKETDRFYYTMIEAGFKNIPVLSFKNLTGEYPTATAFATWLATHVLSGKTPPAEIQLTPFAPSPQTILIYNHFKGRQHSFILLTK